MITCGALLASTAAPAAEIEAPVRLVANNSGITTMQLGTINQSDGEPGVFSKTGTAIRQSASNLGNTFGSWFKNDKADTEPKLPDPWVNSKKAKDPDASLYVAFARLHEQSGDLQAAEPFYHKALSKDPKNLEAMLGLARLYQRMGQSAKALDLCKRAVTTWPNDPSAYNDLGLCHARLGQLDASVAAFQKAIAIEPARKLYRNNIARPLVALGRLDEAYQNLIAVYPPEVAYYNLGYVLNAQGNGRAALHHFEKALAINPGFAEARQWQNQLVARFGRSRETIASLSARPEYVARVPQAAAPQMQSPLASSAAPPPTVQPAPAMVPPAITPSAAGPNAEYPVRRPLQSPPVQSLPIEETGSGQDGADTNSPNHGSAQSTPSAMAHDGVPPGHVDSTPLVAQHLIETSSSQATPATAAPSNMDAFGKPSAALHAPSLVGSIERTETTNYEGSPERLAPAPSPSAGSQLATAAPILPMDRWKIPIGKPKQAFIFAPGTGSTTVATLIAESYSRPADDSEPEMPTSDAPNLTASNITVANAAPPNIDRSAKPPGQTAKPQSIARKVPYRAPSRY